MAKDGRLYIHVVVDRLTTCPLHFVVELYHLARSDNTCDNVKTVSLNAHSMVGIITR